MKDPIDINYSEIYEKMFGNRTQHLQYALPALNKFYGSAGDGIKKALSDILQGDFTGIKSREQDSIKVLKVLSEITDIIEKGGTLQIISSVRDSESEFNDLRMILAKLTGEFKKEDADRFKVISAVYSHFKDRPAKIFTPLIREYAALGKDELTYEEASKINKKSVKKLLDIFNANEKVYVETISELTKLSPKLFGKSMSSIYDLLSDRVSDEEIDNYKPLLSFYLQRLDSLVELATSSLAEIVNQYRSIEDKEIAEIKSKVESIFGDQSIVHERMLSSKEYMIAVSYLGRYEPVIKFIEDEDIKVFSVLMILPQTEKSVKDNPSLRFLITALSGDFDEAIDEFGKKPILEIKKIGSADSIQLIGTNQNTDEGKNHAMMMYLSILAVLHGFDANKLPFVQKFAQ
ncbi:MAG: hypothetical protein WC358_06400 [Ignavibacteria bacterium]